MDAILAAGVPPLKAIEMQSQYSQPADAMNAAMEKKGYPSFSPAFCGAMEGMPVPLYLQRRLRTGSVQKTRQLFSRKLW
ncbi:MAG: hypothetical protein K5641_08030 [Lachnospiraceae bacterium]|nr:hypothetical protein [Lachnospiraceae bacterium]